MERRSFLGLLAVGVAALAAGGSAADPTRTVRAAPPVAGGPPSPGSPEPTATPPSDAATKVTYHRPKVLFEAPRKTSDMALTIDDGYDVETVSAYVQLAQDTGIHLTFSPNGIYQRAWIRHAPVLRPLIEAGQVQIGNHTFSHADLKQLRDADVTAEIERNEAWIATTFGTTSMPYLRPPYGFYDDRVNDLAARAGFPAILMWNGTLGDSALLTQEELLDQARRYVRPGAVLLGHANHPTVTHCYPQLLELIRSREITPVTLDEMFGTKRV